MEKGRTVSRTTSRTINGTDTKGASAGDLAAQSMCLTDKEKQEREEAVKAFLSQADPWEDKVRKYTYALDAFLATKYSPASPRRPVDPVNKGAFPQGLDRRIAAEETLRERIRDAAMHRDRCRDAVNEALGMIDDKDIAETLRLAYLEHKSSSQIGSEMNVTGRQIRRRKAKGYSMIKLPAAWEGSSDRRTGGGAA